MKLKFKTQAYQTAAVKAVVDCFKGQPHATTEAMTYRVDPGKANDYIFATESGFKNAELMLTDDALLKNINQVQHEQHMLLSGSLSDFYIIDNNRNRTPATPAYKKIAANVSRIHLDIEMETGTGKTYCYIKTIFELNQQYGWSKCQWPIILTRHWPLILTHPAWWMKTRIPMMIYR